jgi:hypothetical protein
MHIFLIWHFSARFRVMAFPVLGASRSHSITHTPHSVGLLWTSDQPDAETSTYTTHSTHKTQTPILLAGFEPTIPANDRPQTHALDRAATGIDSKYVRYN